MKKALLALILLLLSPLALHAEAPLAKVKKLPIVKNLLGDQGTLLEARDLGSLYEIVATDPRRGKQIFYVTKDGAYLLAGANLINKNLENLTKPRYDQINKVEVGKLPLQDAIVIKKGNGAKKLIMFSDVDCSFCRKAYGWLQTQTDYTLYVFLSPLDMHPQAHDKSVRVFCDQNRIAALELAQSDQGMTSDKCEAGEQALQEHQAVASEIGVTGTPLFITETGTRISGFAQAEIMSYLKNNPK
jgi:thiol:disulfide interchange protein DsbC